MLIKEKCGYFEDAISETDFVYLPAYAMRSDLFSLFSIFSMQGYRRAGDMMYKNLCPSCRKCQSIRIPVKAFAPGKSQRKVWRINQDIEISLCESQEDMFSDAKIELYRRYCKKHGKDIAAAESKAELAYWNGIEGETGKIHYCGTKNIDYYLDDTLVGVSVIDMLDGGISSVYFYYDISPAIMKRSLGTYSVLRELALCRENNLDYYYLGYYIADCDKMNYKARFKPYELLSPEGDWQSEPATRRV